MLVNIVIAVKTSTPHPSNERVPKWLSLLSYKHTERQRQRQMLVYGDAWELGGGIDFEHHHRPVLAANAAAAADVRCGYTLKPSYH